MTRGTRIAVTLLGALHAVPFLWAACALPWRAQTTFSLLTALAGLGWAAVAVAGAVGPRALTRTWRVASWASLLWFLWCLWSFGGAAVYVAELYGGLGRGVAAGVGAGLAAAALPSVPFAIWGVVATWPRRLKAGGATLLLALLLAVGLRGTAVSDQRSDEGLADAVEQALAGAVLPASDRSSPPELFTERPADCGSQQGPAALLAFRALGDPSVQHHCAVAPAAELPAAIVALLASEHAVAPVLVVDVLVRGSPDRAGFLAGPFALRPGLDGACLGGRCLAAWQLVALNSFAAASPMGFAKMIKLGWSEPVVRDALGGDPGPLQRIGTASFALKAPGRVERLRRQRRDAPGETDRASLEAAAAAVQRYIRAAQEPSGRFAYLVDPHTGEGDSESWNLPRQAGTTLAMCEHGDRSRATQRAVRRSLDFMAEHEQQVGDLSMLVVGKKRRRAKLGSTALPLIAFLSCRDRVGSRYDQLIGRLGKFLLAMQRDDGSFRQRYRIRKKKAVDVDHARLFAEGQAVHALVLLEELASKENSDELPEHSEVRAGVSRAMDYFATGYWSHPIADILYLEENWHCTAARAALGHHRHDGYEQFCLDYATFRDRLLLDEDAGVGPSAVGAFGVSNLMPASTAAGAGYAEGLAAAMAVRQARGEPLDADRERLRLVMALLVRRQWRTADCVTCVAEADGGFSESPAAPALRIDFAQHSWAALGGGLEWLE